MESEKGFNTYISLLEELQKQKNEKNGHPIGRGRLSCQNCGADSSEQPIVVWKYSGVEIEMRPIFRSASTRLATCPDEGEIPTDCQTTEVNKMKVKQEHLAELRGIILESFRDVESGGLPPVLEALVRYLPKEGEVSLSDFIQTEYFDVFEYLFEIDNVEETQA